MYNKTTITLFEENELNISSLYSLYAEKIPDKKQFWERLSREEIAHAVQIGNNKQLSEEVIENKFSQGVISYIMSYVTEEIENAQNHNVTHEQAIRAALRIERSMLEEKCFDVFTSNSKTITDVFKKLNKETQRHIQLLLKEAKKHKYTIN